MNELAHRRGQGRRHPDGAGIRGRAARRAWRFSDAAAKSISQRGFKLTNEQPSRLDGFIASLRDVRRQI